MLNAFERTLATISPAWAYRRFAYRSALEIAARGYAAADANRKTGDWYAPTTSANAEIGQGATRIRARVHDLVRNNPYAAVVPRRLSAKVWGRGIKPSLNIGDIDDPRRQVAMDTWLRFVEHSDPEGQLDFYGQGNVLARTLFEGGEALVRFLPRPASFDLPVPLQLEILEGEQLDGMKNEALKDGGVIIQGVEFDSAGRRVAYWIFPEHPGDAITSFTKRLGFASERVPADQIRHVFEPLRAKQARGVSVFTPIVIKLKNVDDYDDAEAQRKRIASCFAAFVKRPGGMATSPLAKTTTKDASGNRIEKIPAGLIQYLNPEEDVSFSDPPEAEGYVDYIKAQLRAVAVGCGVTYSMLSGDLKDVNFSSTRVGQIDFDECVDQWQWLMVIPQFCVPIWRRVGQIAAGFGIRSVTDPWNAHWTPPGRRFIDPKNDVEAAREAVRSGSKNFYEVIAATGEDPEAFLLERQKQNELLDKLGIVFDSDPRKVGRASAAAPGSQPAADKSETVSPEDQ